VEGCRDSLQTSLVRSEDSHVFKTKVRCRRARHAVFLVDFENLCGLPCLRIEDDHGVLGLLTNWPRTFATNRDSTRHRVIAAPQGAAPELTVEVDARIH
jgi:hypothetical protein